MSFPLNYEMFVRTTTRNSVPDDWPETLQALWWNIKGNWQKAHAIADAIDSKEGCQIHAFLHRLEGDNFNADYWYRRAHLDFPEIDLNDEQKAIIEALILKNST